MKPIVVESLLLRFEACTHAPTSIELRSNAARLAATKVGNRTWSLPWHETQLVGAVIAIEFGPHVHLELREPRTPELDIAMPPLGEITITLSGGDVGWRAECTPESNGRLFMRVDVPITVDGATSALHLRSLGHDVDSTQERATILAPTGSAWSVHTAAHGMRTEPPQYEHVAVPAALEFTAHT